MINASLETITPEVAKKYLVRNLTNRPVRERHVRFLKDEILDNRWKLNGATIVLNGERLVDGQHRLMAVIESGKPIQSIVVHGINSDCFGTVDATIPRNSADALFIAGEKNANSIGAAVRFILGVEKYEQNSNIKISNTEIVDFVKRNPKIQDSFRYVSNLIGNNKSLVSESHLAALHYLFSKKDPELANYVIGGICNGFRRSDANVFFLLRERLIAYSISPTLSRIKKKSRIFSAFIIKAWNAYRNGETLKKFVFLKEEKFPKII